MIGKCEDMKRRKFLEILVGALALIPTEALAAPKKPTPKPKAPIKKSTPKPTKATASPQSQSAYSNLPEEVQVFQDGEPIAYELIKAPTSIYASAIKNGITYPLIVTKPTERSLKVFTARCPHQGNILNLAEKGEYTCKLHGARFDEITGKVIDGPTVSSLQFYEVINKSGYLFIKL